MQKNDLLELYDETYADVYDARFNVAEGYKHVADFEIEVLQQFHTVVGNWIDIACGTGYFLSKFPGISRAGLDYSPSMLKLARERNPDALFLQQGDFRDKHPEWENKWDLVSCMWGAYCYVESMNDINQLIENLCSWTSENGVCFFPLIDIEDVLYWRQSLLYRNPDIQVFGGPQYVTGVIWTYEDSKHNKKHENLISPHIEYLTERFSQTFSRIDVVYYPPYPHPVPGQRKALIATGKNGNLREEMKNVFESIKEQSDENKRNVLTMEQLEKMLNNVPDNNAPDDKLDNSSLINERKAGWLRKIWRTLPQGVQSSIRKAIGEKN